MSMTRKEFLVGTAGLSLTGAASPVKSMLGTRAIESEGEVFENPYVADCLIAMWDGEWNAGWGEHDTNTTVWKDLVGARDLLLQTGVIVEENNMVMSDGMAAGAVSSEIISGVVTCEIVLEVSYPVVSFSDNGVGIIISNGPTESTTEFNGLVAETRGTQTRPLGFQISTTQWALTTPFGVQSLSFSKSISHCGFSKNAQDIPLSAYNNSWWNNYTFSIGRRTSDSLWWIKHKVYSVRLYSRLLTEAEIFHNFAIDVERFGI